jgi:hypothetical protein
VPECGRGDVVAGGRSDFIMTTGLEILVAVLLIMAMGMTLAASPAQAWVITATGMIHSDGPYGTRGRLYILGSGLLESRSIARVALCADEVRRRPQGSPSANISSSALARCGTIKLLHGGRVSRTEPVVLKTIHHQGDSLL